MATTNQGFEKANGIFKEVREKVQNTESVFQKLTHDAGQKLGSFASNIVESATENIKAGKEYVRDNPGKCLGMATAAGLVIGGLMTMAFRRK